MVMASAANTNMNAVRETMDGECPDSSTKLFVSCGIKYTISFGIYFVLNVVDVHRAVYSRQGVYRMYFIPWSNKHLHCTVLVTFCRFIQLNRHSGVKLCLKKYKKKMGL